MSESIFFREAVPADAIFMEHISNSARMCEWVERYSAEQGISLIDGSLRYCEMASVEYDVFAKNITPTFSSKLEREAAETHMIKAENKVGFPTF